MKHALRDALAALERHGEQALADQLRAVYAKRKATPASRGYSATTLGGRKEEKRRRHAEETKAIRAALFDRSVGKGCENCGKRFALLEMDHMLGGSGRRRQRQSVETCWAICQECHRNRTINVPSREFWRHRMRRFLVANEYPIPRELAAPLPTTSPSTDKKESA